MTSFLTVLPSTPLAIARPDEFSDVTDIMVNRRNLISTSPTTQSMSTKQVNARNWLDTFAIAMPDKFSDATDNYRRQEEPDFNKSNDAIGEYEASECPNWLDNRIGGLNSNDFLPE